MRLKTILNRSEKYRSFVFSKSKYCRAHGIWEFSDEVIVTILRPRANGKALCSGCGKRNTIYDTLEERLFEHRPVMDHKLYFAYSMRRVNCRLCGPTVEKVPWADGKKQITKTYEWFLATWGKRLSWLEVARVFQTSWDTVMRACEMAVEWGLKHRDLDNVKSIGVDEIARRKGHKYVTLVYQIDNHCRRLLWIGEDRKEDTLRSFFDFLGKERIQKLRAICSDMWKPYMNVIKERASHVIHVLDRFHIVAHMNKAIDETRADEHKRLKRNGYEPVLKKTRWLLLKRPENLTDTQDVKLAEVLKYNLKSVRAYILKEDFQQFWHYIYPANAGKFLDRWCAKSMRSKIDPMKKVAKMLRKHKPIILNWFRVKGTLSQAIVEGFNNKAKVTTRKSYGFKSFRILRIALYHQLGDLPTPDFTHRFS